MLFSLSIENVAVIEKTQINFENAFNALTGETGAGKSIIIDSIDLLLGERANRELIRSGAKRAFVSAVFFDVGDKVKEILKAEDIPFEEDSLIISREVFIDGRSSAKINSCNVTISFLKSLGRHLINIHGQHDNQTLLHPETHISYLDSFAGVKGMLGQYEGVYKRANQLKNQIKAMSMDKAQKEMKIDMLGFQINEIEAAKLEINEEVKLTERRDFLHNNQRITENVNQALEMLKEENGAKELIENSIRNIETVKEYAAELEGAEGKLYNVKYELEEALDSLVIFSQSLEYQPNELEEIEERLSLIYGLKRKYGDSIAKILEFHNNAKEELQNLSESDIKTDGLKAQLKQDGIILNELALKISALRSEKATELEEKIYESLEFLDMPKVSFKTKIVQAKNDSGNYIYNSVGIDKVEFLISTNAGESLKPLAKVASGGELSRIMLCIKNVLNDMDDIKTLIFDEVDSGVSGRVAEKIGIKLSQIANDKQVICVTHLAQIAALAGAHYLISKEIVEGRTFTDVKMLEEWQRVEELARIIGGINITQTTLDTAKEMLQQAKTTKGE